MPELPYLDAGVGEASSVPRGFASAGGDGAAAIASTLQGVAAASQRIFDKHQRSKLRLALSQSAIALGEAQDQIRAAGNFETAEEEFQKAVAAQRDAAKGLGGEYAQEFEMQLATLSAGETLRLRDWARQETARSVRANADSSSKNWIARFADTGEDDFLTQAFADLEEAGDAFKPEELVTARENLLLQAAGDRAAVLIQRDPKSAEVAFKTDPFFDRIPEAKRAQLIEAAQAEAAERQRLALQQMQYAAAQEARAVAASSNENFNVVLDMHGSMSPQEIDALNWRDAGARAQALNWNQAQQDRAARLAEAVAGEPETDWAYVAELQRKRVHDPQGLVTSTLDLERLGTDELRKSWLKIQADASAGSDEGGVFTHSELANAAWSELATTEYFDGLSDAGDEHRGRFDTIVERRFQEFRRDPKNNGRAPNNQEFLGLLDEASVEFHKTTNVGRPLARKPGAAPPSFGVPAAPLTPQTRAQIIEALRASGAEPTEALILEIFREMQP
jgi:hypothetical protein